MARTIAFLRGINVGGHRIRMEVLRREFEALGLAEVATFIASGNVIFTTRAADQSELESRIERHLQSVLGYAVDTHLRTTTEVAAIVESCPFLIAEMETPGHTVHVGFLKEPPPSALIRQLADARTAMDDFQVEGREFFWLCRGKITESLVPWPKLSRLVGARATLRNLKTIRKLNALYPGH